MRSGNKSEEPNQTDILTDRVAIASYCPDIAAIMLNAGAAATNGGQRAAQLDSDEGGNRNAAIGQRIIADIYQQEVDKSLEALLLRTDAGLEEVRKIADDLRTADAAMAVDARVNIITEPLDAAIVAARTACADLRLTAYPVLREEAEATAARNTMHREHPIRPPARFSRKPLTQIGLIFATAAAESVANSFFFMDATDYGLLGGWSQVVFLTPINVVFAVLFGIISLRYPRHRNKNLQRIGWTSAFVFVILILAFNIYLVAVRLTLQSTPHLDMSAALAMIFSSNVLSAVDYQSVAIFVFGLLFAGFAAWEAFLLYDPYPGYTACIRRLEKAQAAVRRTERRHVACLAKIGHGYTDRLSARLGVYTKSIADLGRYQQLMAADRLRHDHLSTTLLNDYEKVIREFRAVYLGNPILREVDLPPIPLVKDRGPGELPLDLTPVMNECREILIKLDRLSRDAARQISAHIIANQENTRELMREIAQDAMYSRVNPTPDASSESLRKIQEGVQS